MKIEKLGPRNNKAEMINYEVTSTFFVIYILKSFPVLKKRDICTPLNCLNVVNNMICLAFRILCPVRAPISVIDR